MFADTITITINSVAKVLQRINDDAGSSRYRLREADGEFNLTLRQSSFKAKDRMNVTVERHSMDLTHTIYPVAPATKQTVRHYYQVLENEVQDTTAAVQNFGVGSAAFFTAGNVLKLINGES